MTSRLSHCLESSPFVVHERGAILKGVRIALALVTGLEM
jgi:hypothetical protein